jgi:catechol 2,3-dioxygenase-like lactoylglutathione lyase family enzyme
MSQPTAVDPCEDAYPKGRLYGALTSTIIECRDLEPMETFYRDALGVPVTLRGEGWVMLGVPPGEIVLWTGEKTELVPSLMGADVPAAAAAAAALGLEPTQVYEHPGGTHFYLRDPDGNKIQVGDQ